ncbi:hypothetical protein HDV63DRAFT_376135 [Trichoderma sp. SZMC 28014]
MLAKNDESAITPGRAANAEGTLEPDSTPENTAQYKIAAACFTTTVLNIVATRFEKEPGNTCWTTSALCESWELPQRVRFLFPIGEHSLCEICLLTVALLTCLHWSCVFSLFCQRRWQENFLPVIIVATFVTLLPIATFVQDPTIVFLGLLPIVIDVYISACAIFHYAEQARFLSQVSGNIMV